MLSLSPRAHVDAFVHTEGVVLGSRYVPLELTYRDRLGYETTFRINSPVSFQEARAAHLHVRPEAIMLTSHGVPYHETLRFLQDRFHLLQQRSREPVVFGYKGESYQPNVLRDAGIPKILNVEQLGVPAIRVLQQKYGHAVGGGTPCPHHMSPRRNKCSRAVARLVLMDMVQQEGVLLLETGDPGHQLQH